MLRIYGYDTSINVRKVLWACDEIGLSYEREDWAGGFRPTSDPAFLALNPVGMVPVIDDDGAIIWESNTIVRYLAASRRRDDLYPAQPARRAQIEMWMDWQGSDLNNSWRTAFQGLVRKNPDVQDPAAIAKSMALFSDMIGIIDGCLATSGGFIAGPDFTIADIPIGLSIHRWKSMPRERPLLRQVEDYYERLCARAGFQRHGRDGGP